MFISLPPVSLSFLQRQSWKPKGLKCSDVQRQCWECSSPCPLCLRCCESSLDWIEYIVLFCVNFVKIDRKIPHFGGFIWCNQCSKLKQQKTYAHCTYATAPTVSWCLFRTMNTCPTKHLCMSLLECDRFDKGSEHKVVGPDRARLSSCPSRPWPRAHQVWGSTISYYCGLS